MDRDRDNFKILEKFERMIQDDNPVYLDLNCLLYTSPSPRDGDESRMASSA